jgi:RHS repeat-associated protein
MTFYRLGQHDEELLLPRQHTRGDAHREQHTELPAGRPSMRFATDRLGSQAITTSSSGTLSAEIRYYPWGTERYTYGTMPTTYHFTGQRLESSFGLYFYNSRWYDPLIGRFIQPDTIIPQEQQGVQAWDRYAYSYGNPIKYIDPTGHYGKKVHRDLTYQIVHDAAMNIADEMGFGLNEINEFANYLASEVVRGDMAADSLNPDGTINPNYLYMNSLTPPISISLCDKNIIDEKSPSWYTTPEAEENLNNAKTPFEFGIASHEYQDSFSRWQKLGEPDTPIETWLKSGWNAIRHGNINDRYEVDNPIDFTMTNGYTVYVNSFVQTKANQWRFYGH